MDPITLALAGLNLAGQGYNFYEQGNLNRAQTSFGRAQGGAEIRAAENARAQLEEDLARRRRMMQESLASRGVGESTIATDDLNYLNRGADRQMESADDRVRLAHQGLNLFNRQSRSRRRGNYINMGLGALNALGGAYTMGAFGGGADPAGIAAQAHSAATGFPASNFRWS